MHVWLYCCPHMHVYNWYQSHFTKHQAAAQADVAAAALRDIEERARYGAGDQVAASGLAPLSTERYAWMGLPSPKKSAVVGNCGGFLGNIWFGCDYVCIPDWLLVRALCRICKRERGR
jgi:hypothetical protein